MPKFIADSSVRVLVMPLTYTGMKGEAYMKPGMLCPYCRRHLKAKNYVELVKVVKKHAEEKHAEAFEKMVRTYGRDRDRYRFEGHIRASVLNSIVPPLPGSEESIYASALDESGQLLFRYPIDASMEAHERWRQRAYRAGSQDSRQSAEDAARSRYFEKWLSTQEERYKFEVARFLIEDGYGQGSWSMRFTQKYLGAIKAAAHIGEFLDQVEMPNPSPEPPQAVQHVQQVVMPSDKKNTSK